MSKLKLAAHSARHDTVVVEVWSDTDEFIAAIYPGRDRRIRVISKHPMQTERVDDEAPGAIEIEIGHGAATRKCLWWFLGTVLALFAIGHIVAFILTKHGVPSIVM